MDRKLCNNKLIWYFHKAKLANPYLHNEILSVTVLDDTSENITFALDIAYKIE